MKYTVITTFHQEGLELYGQNMINTFEQHWPDSVDLIVYAENCEPHTTKSNVQVIDLLAANKSLRKFLKRHINNPEANGGRGPHNQAIWSEKKSFKWQAVRFCYKVFATQHAAEHINTDWLIWLDADSHTHSRVNNEFLQKVCPQEHLISYLGRTDRYHSECGWVAYNMQNPLAIQYIQHFANMYETDAIFNYKEWHDSFIWDEVRKHFRDHKGATFYNLNPEPDTKGLAGHPFINSELGSVMDHKKGDRKHKGHSKAKEVRLHTQHPYWRKVLGG
jgi:hypothetical protein